MLRMLLQWLLSAISLLIVARYVSGFVVSDHSGGTVVDIDALPGHCRSYDREPVEGSLDDLALDSRSETNGRDGNACGGIDLIE